MNRQKLLLLISNSHRPELIFSNEAVYSFLRELNTDYPNFDQWFFEKVVNGIESKGRKIIAVSYFDQIIAAAIVKKDSFEKKICTLRVHPDYQRQGLGTYLMRKSIEEVGIRNPLITVPSTRLHQFSPLLARHNFQLCEVVKNYYRHGVDEYVFNGKLY